LRWTSAGQLSGGTTEDTTGIKTHFILFKPSPENKNELINAYIAAKYSDHLGWNDQGVKGFSGVLGLNRFLSHYSKHNGG
jgi:hypothetical protein